MKKHAFFSVTFLFFLSSVQSLEAQHIVLGNIQALKTWVYLCGLTQTFDAGQEVQDRALLDKIGKELGIKITALHPKNRCSDYNNMLCWPHESSEKINETFANITSIIDPTIIAGFIGFSNGGFFLNHLVQHRSLGVPIISIGAAGYLANNTHRNKLFLIVGTEDEHHINGARDFFNRAHNSALNTEIIEFTGGHEIPEKELREVLSLLQPKVGIIQTILHRIKQFYHSAKRLFGQS